MLNLQLTLGTGVYGGMYLAQNYDVPKVDEPGKIIDKIKDVFDSVRRRKAAKSSTKQNFIFFLQAKKEVEEAKKKVEK